MPVRQRPGDAELATGGDQLLALQCRLDRGDRGLGQRLEVGQRLVFDLAPVTVGAAQQHRLVSLFLADLVTYVRLFRATCIAPFRAVTQVILNRLARNHRCDTPILVATFVDTDTRSTQVTPRIAAQNCRNFGLEREKDRRFLSPMRWLPSPPAASPSD